VIDTYSNNTARYSVGIDLGTTHCVLSSVDLTLSEDEDVAQQVMSIPQLTSPGVVDEKNQLPSFLYQAHEDELAENDMVLPWTDEPETTVGELARKLGSKTPIRLVSSAKSWLCHSGVDCRSKILPVEAPEEIDRVSPLQASIYYLEHLKNAWDHSHPDEPLEEQDVTITVPASFDPAARELTAEAARTVGIGQAILLEEPQSALYSWIQQSGDNWRDQVNLGDIILVVDVGGGTTDLSLIAVTQQEGQLELNRIAVGDHILLGGDNMDLALAYTVKVKLESEGKVLEPWQIQALMHGCRDAKETIFLDSSVTEVPLVVPSRGSSLVGGSIRSELTRDEVDSVLAEGFLPKTKSSEQPFSQARTGLTTIGLPYAQDAAISRHLGFFLSRQLAAIDDIAGYEKSDNATFLHPTAVLLNGGVLKAESLSGRLMEILNDWLVTEQAPPARLLEGADLDLSVARGAAYYGYVRQGGGVRIRGGTAASYYVGVESAMPAVPGMPPPLQALCIAPFGMEEGTEQELPPHEFGLVVGEPVRFRFFGSTVRREDKVGIRLDHWAPQDLEELDEIEVTLPVENRTSGEVVPVQLCAAITEVGTLKLEAVSRDGENRWKVEFDVRAGDDHPQVTDTQTPTMEDANQAEDEIKTSEPPDEQPASQTEEIESSAVDTDNEDTEKQSEDNSGSKRFWSFNKK